MLQRKKEREGLEAEISKSVSKSQTTVPGILYDPIITMSCTVLDDCYSDFKTLVLDTFQVLIC